jgi:hypothetical protein
MISTLRMVSWEEPVLIFPFNTSTGMNEERNMAG